MLRVRLFEFESLAWFLRSIRDAETDLLRFMWEAGRYLLAMVSQGRIMAGGLT